MAPMPPLIIAAILASIAATGGLTWMLWRLNKSGDER